MEQYQRDPIGFCTEVLGIRRETIVWSENPGYENHQWDGTPDPIATWFRALAEGKDVAVLSATGQGKSFGLALTKMWFLASWVAARCFDFAFKKEQLEEYSWTELAKLWPRFKQSFPQAHLSVSGLRLRMDGRIREGEGAGWGAVGFGYVAGQEEQLAGGGQGMHGRDMLVSVEEAAKVPISLTNALSFTVGGRHNIRQFVGNPDSEDDALNRMAREEGVVAIRISALDHPNVVVNVARDPEWEDLENDIDVVPGASGRKWVLRQEKEYGRSNWIYQSRVRGMTPPQHAKALIRREQLERAYEIWLSKEKRFGQPALGVDVARSLNGNYGAIASGLGAHLDHVERFPCPNPVQLGLRLAAIMAAGDIHEQHVAVDVGGGYGGGTADRLKELGLYIHEFNGGASASARLDETLLDEKDIGVLEGVLFRNRRAQAYWRLAMDLQHGRVGLPRDEMLWEELLSVRWEPKLGKIVLEEKADVEERLGRSPDGGDAVVMWNWVRPRFHEEPEVEIRAWDPEVLEHEALEGRRVRTRPSGRPKDIPPTVLEAL